MVQTTRLGEADSSPVDWSKDDISHVPYELYSSDEIYQRELARIFYGPSWNYVGLAAEVPNSGDFRLTNIGEKPVIMVRDEQSHIHVVENRCAHRGVRFCHKHAGNAKELLCPYHQWAYRLDGSLQAVPYRRGIKKSGGMPADFDLKQHGLTRLRVAERNGVVFASYSDSTPDLETWLGPKMLHYFDRVFDGRKLRILGRHRQRTPGNWKLMFENIKDPYHASLLHVFFITFGLFRADENGRIEMDETGMHAVLISDRGGDGKVGDETRAISTFREDLKLQDPRILDKVIEYPGTETVVMQTLWPNLIVQQQTNCMSMRQITPRGPGAYDFVWTHFAYEEDSAEMIQRRLRQANLFGPAGLVSADDGEVIEFSQAGLGVFPGYRTIIAMDGRHTNDSPHVITETAIRKFYHHYRKVMEL